MASDKTYLRELLLFCGVILFLTMPRVLSPGDGYGPRTVAANLVMTGHLAIPFSERDKIDYLSTRGEYFFEDDQRQLLFSKWGIFNTICNLPAALAERIYAGKVDLVDLSLSYIFFVNLNYLLLSLILIAYLYQITALYEKEARPRLIVVVTMVFATYLWHYLRCHMHELFQLLPFLGFIYHYLLFLRISAEEPEGGERRWRHLTISAVWVGLLVLAKPNYLAVMGAAWIFVLAAGPTAASLGQRVRANLAANRTRVVLHLLVPSVCFVAILLLLNYYRFGDAFDNGYSQESLSAPGEVGFSLGVLRESLPGFLLLPGNANIFLHFPLLFFALFGMRRFWKKWSAEAAFLSFVVLSNCLLIACYLTWRGEMTYGPRYLLLFVVIATLPLLETMRWMRERWETLRAKGVAALFAVVTFGSFLMQLSVNTIYDFTPQFHDAYFFSQFQVQEIEEYHQNYLTQGTFAMALLAYKFGWRDYYPLQVLEVFLEREDPEWDESKRKKLEEFMDWEIRINYFFLRPWLTHQDYRNFEEALQAQEP